MYKECLDFLILVHSITFYFYNDAANSTLITEINYIVQYMHIYETAIIKGQKNYIITVILCTALVCRIDFQKH